MEPCVHVPCNQAILYLVTTHSYQPDVILHQFTIARTQLQSHEDRLREKVAQVFSAPEDASTAGDRQFATDPNGHYTSAGLQSPAGVDPSSPKP